MKKIIRYSLYGLLGLFVIIQFFQTDKTNPPVDPAKDFIAATQPDPSIANRLRGACYDCHSNESKYPWYSYVAPLSWYVQNHITEGREHLNFSEWTTYSSEDQAEILEESGEELQKGKMPLKPYPITHPEAKMSETEKQELIAWFGKAGGNNLRKEELGMHDESGEEHKEND